MRLGGLLLGLALMASSALAQPRVVFLGEEHTSAADHEAQLEALQELQDQPLLIVAEMFTERAEQELAKWNASSSIELTAELWKREWGHPYELYDPIFGWARTEKVPLLWLRPDPEQTKQVREKGPAAAVPRLGEVLIGPASYREFMADVARGHVHGEPSALDDAMIDRMFTVQCYWDEFMAWRIAELAKANPEHVLVVLVGDGHLRDGEGVPWRLARRAPGLAIEVRRSAGGLRAQDDFLR